MPAVKSVLSVSTSQGGSYTTLPTPVEMTVSFQTLDSAKSGRDNNTGKMFRDMVATKLTAKVTLPYGITKSQLAGIMNIITRGSFWAKLMNPKDGSYSPVNVYCATVEPPIAHVTLGAGGTPTDWIYDTFELDFVEM